MPKTSAQQLDPTAMAGPYAETAATVGNAVVETMMQASQAYVETVLAAGQETVSFANRRLDTDLKTCSRLANCGSYEDAAKVQQDWASSALEEYSREWSRMAKIFADRFNAQSSAAAKAARQTAKATE